jgi:hypothetical protein
MRLITIHHNILPFSESALASPAASGNVTKCKYIDSQTNLFLLSDCTSRRKAHKKLPACYKKSTAPEQFQCRIDSAIGAAADTDAHLSEINFILSARLDGATRATTFPILPV